MEAVEVVVAHAERATLRVGDVFVKIDGDQARLDRELAAMAAAPIPTAEVRWHQSPAMALQALRGAPMGRLGMPSTASSAAWTAVGTALRVLHSAPLPPWPGKSLAALRHELDVECSWLLDERSVPTQIVERGRSLAAVALRPWESVFIHGDLQVDHVFIERDEVTGVLDWSEAAPGDACYDLAVLTLGNRDRLDQVIEGYGIDVDRDVVRGWWAWRCLVAIRWLHLHGYGAIDDFPEVEVLRALA